MSFDSFSQVELYARIDMLNRYFENPHRAKQSLQASEYFVSSLNLFQELLLKSIVPPSLTIADRQRLSSFLGMVENFFAQQHDIVFYSDLLNEEYSNLEDTTLKSFDINPEGVIQLRAIRQSVRMLLSQKATINSVAAKLNFNVLEWKQLFKKINGLPPDKYIFKCSPEIIKHAYALA